MKTFINNPPELIKLLNKGLIIDSFEFGPNHTTWYQARNKDGAIGHYVNHNPAMNVQVEVVSVEQYREALLRHAGLAYKIDELQKKFWGKAFTPKAGALTKFVYVVQYGYFWKLTLQEFKDVLTIGEEGKYCLPAKRQLMNMPKGAYKYVTSDGHRGFGSRGTPRIWLYNILDWTAEDCGEALVELLGGKMPSGNL